MEKSGLALIPLSPPFPFGMVGEPLSLVINWISQEYKKAFIAFDRSRLAFEASLHSRLLLTRLRKQYVTRLPHLPLHSCLLSPTGLPLVLPYSIPLLGSSLLVWTSTSQSSRPLSCALCLVHMRPTGASHPLWANLFALGFVVVLFRLGCGCSLVVGLLWFLAVALLLRAQVPLALFMDPF